MGSIGLVIIFVCALVGCGLLTLLLLLYFGHYYLHVLADASAGSTAVRPADESLIDAWHGPVLCLVLLVFWTLIGSLVLGPFFIHNAEAFLVALPTFLALVYPVSLLGILSALNWFMPVYLPVLARLARQAGALLLVYLITLPVCAVALGLYGAAVWYGAVWWIVGAALVLPLAALIHARVWGRLAWLALNARAPRRAPERSVALAVENPWGPPPEPEVPEMDIEVLPAETPKQEPPAAPVDEEEDEWSPHKKPYGLAEERSWQETSSSAAEPPAGDGYEVANDAPPRRPGVSEVYEELALDDRRRRAILAGRGPSDAEFETKRPTLGLALGARLWTGLFSSAALVIWLSLAALVLAQLVLLRLMVATWPRGV